MSTSVLDRHREPPSDAEIPASGHGTTNPVQKPEVKFSPPLYEQRRAWILGVLRRERVTSLLDIGCGEGSLLRCLCNPASYLLRSSATTGLDCAKQSAKDSFHHHPHHPHRHHLDVSLSSHNPPNQSDHPPLDFDLSFDRIPELRMSRLVGLDISEPELAACVSATAPRPSSSEPLGFSIPRWEPLDVHIWRGSLDVLNEAFIDVECIVSSEVIEHLEPDVFQLFAPMLLGAYRPRFLLVTTPNFTFNERFSAPGSTDVEGYPDPTGRTSRIFRHHDHKFEWTVDEFSAYCESEAERYGYSAEIDAIGLPLGVDPWGREVALGRATQVVLFRRQDVLTLEHDVARRLALSDARRRDRKEHKLVVTHTHTPHPQASHPFSSVEIQSSIAKQMEEYYTEDGWSVWDLWTVENVSASCGGYLDVLLSSITSCSTLELTRLEGRPTLDWRVKFANEKHEELVKERKTVDQWTRLDDSPKSSSYQQTSQESPQTWPACPSSLLEANYWRPREEPDWAETGSWRSDIDVDHDDSWAYLHT